MAEELRVSDSEFTDMATALRSYGADFEAFVTRYCGHIDELCADGVASGEFHQRLVLFAAQARLLQDQATQIANQLASACDAYVAQVDSLDQDMY